MFSLIFGIFIGTIYKSKLQEDKELEQTVPINQDFVCRRILHQYYMESNTKKKKVILKQYFEGQSN